MVKLLDFWAEWCGPCKMMEPILDEAMKALEGKVELVKYNVDEDPETASKYGVLSIPTYVIVTENAGDKEGQEVDRIVGFTQKDAFIEKIKKHVGGDVSHQEALAA